MSLVLLHVGAALLALLAGTLAVFVAKGRALHIRSGQVFVASTIVLALPAAWLSFQNDSIFDVMSSVLVCYLALSGGFSFRREPAAVAWALMALALGCACSYVYIEGVTLLTGLRNTDAPIGAGYVFAILLGLAMTGDIKRRCSGNVSRRQQLVRHMWRMCFALFMATGNLFAVRAHLFPEWMQSSGLLVVLAVFPLLLMAFWRLKLSRIDKWACRIEQMHLWHYASKWIRGVWLS